MHYDLLVGEGSGVFAVNCKLESTVLSVGAFYLPRTRSQFIRLADEKATISVTIEIPEPMRNQNSAIRAWALDLDIQEGTK